MSRALRRQRQKALPLELAKRSIFDYAPLFRVCFLCPVELPARDWRPVSWRVVAELCFGFFVDYAKGGGKSSPP